MSSGSTATKSASRRLTFSRHSIRSRADTQLILAKSDGRFATSSLQVARIKCGTHILSEKYANCNWKFPVVAAQIRAHIQAYRHPLGRIRSLPQQTTIFSFFSRLSLQATRLRLKVPRGIREHLYANIFAELSVYACSLLISSSVLIINSVCFVTPIEKKRTAE